MNFLLMFWLFLISGNPFFSNIVGSEVLNLITAFVLFIVFLFKKIGFNAHELAIFILFIVIFILQSVYYNSIYFVTNMGFLIKLFIAYAGIKLIYNFQYVYIRTMYIVCVLALSFWTLDLLGVVDDVITMLPYQTISNDGSIKYLSPVHTFFYEINESFIRNSGLFWEPGAFSAYITLALIFLGIERKNLFRKEYAKHLIVFVITLLTTLSTSGYVVLLFVIILHYDFSHNVRYCNKKILNIFLLIIAMVFVALIFKYFFMELDFIGGKIIRQSEIDLTEYSLSNVTRFGTALFDFKYISESPFIGNGLNEATRYRFHLDNVITGYSNGFTDFVAKFGIIITFVYMAYVFKGLNMLTNSVNKSLYCLAIILLLNNTQGLLNYPIYLSLIFLYFNPRRYINNSYKNVK